MTAVKHILIPEPNYRALVDDPNKNSNTTTIMNRNEDEAKPKFDYENNGEDVYLKYMKERMQQTLQKKPENPYEATKLRAKYQELLKSYLKLRNQIRNKPTKVEVANVGELFAMREPSGEVKAGLYYDDDGEIEPVNVKSIHEYDWAATTPTPNKSFEEIYESPSQENTTNSEPPTRREVLKAKEEERQRQIKEREEEILKKLQNDPLRYGITTKGKILNKFNEPIQDSDVRSVVRRLIDPKSTIFSPPGTTSFRSRILKDEEIKPLFTPLFGQGRNKQSGKGQLGVYKRPVQKRNSFHFKPQLWTK